MKFSFMTNALEWLGIEEVIDHHEHHDKLHE